MAKVKFDVKDAVRKLDAARMRLSDMTMLFKDIADLENTQTRLRFKEEEDPTGEAWPDPITIRRDSNGGSGRLNQEKAWSYFVESDFLETPPGWHVFSRAKGDKAMRDTGNLLNSIGVSYGKDYAIVGTNVEYAQSLQDGRFPFLGINKKTSENVNKAMEVFLKGIFK